MRTHLQDATDRNKSAKQQGIEGIELEMMHTGSRQLPAGTAGDKRVCSLAA
jgi:hypothetical protein